MFSANLGAVVSAAATTYWLNSAATNDSGGQTCVGYDSSNNVYVMGNQAGTSMQCYVQKFNSAGTLQWQRVLDITNPISAVGIAVTAAGDVYAMTGFNSSQVVLFRLNTSGTTIWSNTYSLTTSAPSGGNLGVAVDSANAPYFLVPDSADPGFMYVLKLTAAAGAITWQFGMTGTSTTIEGAGIGLDSSNNLYTLIYDPNSSAARISKFNSASTLQWQKDIATSAASLTARGGLVVAPAGDTYTLASVLGANATVTKLNTSGVLQWERTLVGSANNPTIQNGTVDAATGDVYVVGYHNPNVSGSVSGIILKFNSAGTLQWQRRITHNTLAVIISNIRVSSGVMYLASYINTVVFKLPTDGTKTGTYGGYTYGTANPLTVSNTTPTIAAGAGSTNTPSGTVSATSTLTTVTLTNTLTNIP